MQDVVFDLVQNEKDDTRKATRAHCHTARKSQDCIETVLCEKP